MIRQFYFLGLLALITVLGACNHMLNHNRDHIAHRLAMPAFMIQRAIPISEDLELVAWERMHQRYTPATIYLESYPLQHDQSHRLFQDPTPGNPVALHLATRDRADNVIHLAQPCQYVSPDANESCGNYQWVVKERMPNSVAAFQSALSEIKARYDISGFHLVAYGDSANIASQLAAQRGDILSLRTVAGLLDPTLAASIAHIPQHHFIGAGDTHVPPSVYHDFRNAMGPSRCVHYTLVQDADHERGWVERWPDLLERPLTCVPEPSYEPFPALPPAFKK